MCWNYFASGHGKGEVDGAGTFLKCKIHKEQIKSQAYASYKIHMLHFVKNKLVCQFTFIV
jgi:hypothetical protein